MTEMQAIARRLDLRRAGNWWRGRCPVCGNDSLSAAPGRLGLRACCHYGCDAGQVRAALGDDAATAPDPAADERKSEARQKAAERAARTWSGAALPSATDPAGLYLARRGLAAAIGNAALRYRADTPHPAGGRLPSMLCRIDGPDGEMVAIHRIYLDRQGHKAGVEPVKATLGPMWTGAIRFGTGPEIAVAEGPETALAAGIILGLPAWSSISCGNLARGLILPAEIRKVTIAADHDRIDPRTGNRPGLHAASAAARRWEAEGRAVRIVRPDTEGQDFADVLAIRLREAA